MSVLLMAMHRNNNNNNNWPTQKKVVGVRLGMRDIKEGGRIGFNDSFRRYPQRIRRFRLEESERPSCRHWSFFCISRWPSCFNPKQFISNYHSQPFISFLRKVILIHSKVIPHLLKPVRLLPFIYFGSSACAPSSCWIRPILLGSCRFRGRARSGLSISIIPSLDVPWTPQIKQGPSVHKKYKAASTILKLI